tara:strand:+ start:328 stop:510 length:183 start_codon:yes stop_codon:yes gene_type:complete
MNTLETNTKAAYESGFKDGFNTGEENNPFEDGELYRAYRDGYSSGVTEYCFLAHPKEWEE